MSSRTTIAGVALFVFVSVGAAWVVFDLGIRRSSRDALVPPVRAATVAPAVPAVRSDVAVVESVQGTVQRSAGESWAPLSAGDRLQANESLRTGVGGGTALRIGDKSRLAVSPSSQLVIRELSETLHRFKLTKGHLRVEYQPDAQRVLRIEGSDEQAVAVTRGARFSVLSTGRTIAIATAAGSVDLESHGSTVHVDAGRESSSRPDSPPSPPQPVSTTLWLKVANAMARAPEGICGSLQGSAPRGAEVTIDGNPVQLASDGSFSVRVQRARGRDDVTVSIRDAAGRTSSRTIACAEEQGGVDDVALQWHKPGAEP